TAISSVLEAMSGPQPDLGEVFKTIADHAVKLCDATNVSVELLEGELARIVANAGAFVDRETWERSAPTHAVRAGRATLAGRVMLERRTVQIEDLYADPEYDRAAGHVIPSEGNRTLLDVPIQRGGLLGVIVARRKEVRKFSAREIEILETFAQQAAIAIENVRLFNETKEAL